MILQCKNCGAPLDVQPKALYTKCNYCGTTSKRRELTTQFGQTPPGWTPPPVWTPPPTFHVHTPLAYHQVSRAYRAGGGAVAMVVLMPLLMAGGIAFFVWRQVDQAMSGFGSSNRESPTAKDLAWDGKSTLSCSSLQSYDVSGVDVATSLDVAIDASGSCEVHIKNSTLRADTLATASGAAKIYITDSTLIVGTSGVVAGNSSRIELSGVTLRLGAGRASLDGVTAIETKFGSGEVAVLTSTIEVGTAGQPGEAYLVKSNGGAVSFRGGSVTGRYKILADFFGGKIETVGIELAPTAIEGEGAHKVRGIRVAAGPASAASSGAPAPGAPRPPAVAPPKSPPKSAPPPPPPPPPAPPPKATTTTTRRR
ncbi:MAG: hypothetical protein HY908_34885 [Myxococcales bacterium]|nr:hypothetical protein [Myxococcales bacterium]